MLEFGSGNAECGNWISNKLSITKAVGERNYGEETKKNPQGAFKGTR